ncbi:hypothetical protein [Paraburkholderia susongensis]|uniref:hypothetical protein n=1 Tax=Paraburkholderia susongensis TaxID=1515439 RepID=UPI000A1CE68B|nr:hypothetical protein [Paraburkholderia susongensis]
MKQSSLFAFVLFDATGDLSFWKTIPALYQSDLDRPLSPEDRIIAVSRDELDTLSFCGLAGRRISGSDGGSRTGDGWLRLVNRFDYVRVSIVPYRGGTGPATRKRDSRDLRQREQLQNRHRSNIFD